jgi:hypothetical protein
MKKNHQYLTADYKIKNNVSSTDEYSDDNSSTNQDDASLFKRAVYSKQIPRDAIRVNLNQNKQLKDEEKNENNLLGYSNSRKYLSNSELTSHNEKMNQQIFKLYNDLNLNSTKLSNASNYGASKNRN